MVESNADRSTVDLVSSRIKLNDGVLFMPQLYRGSTFYHVEDTAASRFYRIGYAEYVFVSLLDGESTFAEALTVTAQKLGPSALTQSQAIEVYSWLIENDLARFVGEDGRSARERAAKNRPGLLEYPNPFWAKFSFGCPDRLITALVPGFAWLFSPPVVALFLALIAVATATVYAHWDRFLATSEIVFSPSNWAWMLLAWVILKVVHEFAHGIACRRYGSEVRDVGLVFILFAPLAYVDVTSSWRLSSKWQRINVAAAGIYVELVIAAMAAIAWSRAESALAAHLLYNFVFMASLSTLVFNLNPLMRFDGYYILADLLEIPNLYPESSQRVRRMASRLFYGTGTSGPAQIRETRWFLGCYGLAATIWRIAACASLALIASALFHGAGIVLTVLGLACWLGTPVRQLAQDIHRRFHESPYSLCRALLVSAFFFVLVVGCFTWVPSPMAITAPGIVDYQDLAVIRSDTPGFIDQIHVTDGQEVQPGDLVMTLRNEDVVNAYEDLQLAINQSRTRHRMAVDRRETALAQVEQRNQEAILQRLAVARRRYEALSVRAPVAGRIVARTIAQQIGTYVESGQELLAIGNESSKDLVVSIGDDKIDEVIPAIGTAVQVRIGSRRAVAGLLTRVEPRASTQLPHPALAATEGGPLTVKEPDDEERQANRNLELTEPRYRAVVRLPDGRSSPLFCGERGVVSFGPHRQPIGIALNRRLTTWIDAKKHGSAER